MLRKFLTSILMVALLFSNVPFGLLSSLLETYRASQNVIDVLYGLDEDENIVDKFIPIELALLRLKIPEAYAAVGDARVQYGRTTNATPQTRFYTNSTNSYGAAGATVAGTANVGWVVSKESPTEDVTVMITQSTTGMLDAFCRSGSTWTKDWSISVGTTAATRRFDIEFEKTSGVPMVLYSKNVITTNELGYRRKTGAGCGAAAWTSEALQNPAQITGIVLWVEMEARQTSGSNVLAAAFSDSAAVQGGRLSSLIWTGSAWGNEPAAAHDASLELQGTVGANAAKVFDVAFESLSGDLILSWGNSAGANGTNGFRYATCAAALPCTWSAAITPAGPLDDATHVAAAPDPSSDAVAFISIGNGGADLQAWTWTGSAVGVSAPNADTATLAPGAGFHLVDIDWVVSGTQRMAVGVYANAANGYSYIYYDTVGNAWRTNSAAGFVVTGAPTTVGRQLQVITNPANLAQLMFLFTDSGSDLWSKRLAYNGAAGGATVALATWSNADGGVALETTMSSIAAQAFWYDWVRFASAPPPPSLTTYTNSTESGLNYAAACTGCGARIGGGALFRHSITITGLNFGADPGVGNRSSASNNVKVGTKQIASANVTAWSATSITFLTDTAVSGDADSDWGANFGGTNALTVTAGGQTSTGLNFYVFPQVVSITQPSGFLADSAREYNAADADGVIILNGTRFGTGPTGGSVSVLGSAATVVADVSCDAGDGWANQCVKVQVPTAISDSVNTGSISVTQGTGSNNKPHTYVNTFRILPRIIANTPTSDAAGNVIQIDGNHFCQSGTCPASPPTAADKVEFGATAALASDFVTSPNCSGASKWSHTQICVKVPAAAPAGSQPTKVTSNTLYTSNTMAFTVLSPTPVLPTNTAQSRNSGFTDVIPQGGYASSTPVYFAFDTSSGTNGGTMYPQLEVRPVLGAQSAFTGNCTGNPYCNEGTGTAYAGGTLTLNVSSTTAPDLYHWHVRVRYNVGGTDYLSPWQSYPDGDPTETSTDFNLDTTPPAISSVSAGTPGTNAATITWSTLAEAGTSQVQYQAVAAASCAAFSFAASCATNNDCTTIDQTLVTPHSVPLSNLNSGTDYCFRARSKDAAGNESMSTNSSFTTATVNQPAKTVRFHAGSLESVVTGVATSTQFTVHTPEVSPKVKSAYIEVLGLVSGGTNPIDIAVNSNATTSYAVNATSPTYFRFLYKVTDYATDPTPENVLNLNDASPCTYGNGSATSCNRVIIAPGSGMSIVPTSVQFIITYAYAP